MDDVFSSLRRIFGGRKADEPTEPEPEVESSVSVEPIQDGPVADEPSAEEPEDGDDDEELLLTPAAEGVTEDEEGDDLILAPTMQHTEQDAGEAPDPLAFRDLADWEEDMPEAEPGEPETAAGDAIASGLPDAGEAEVVEETAGEEAAGQGPVFGIFASADEVADEASEDEAEPAAEPAVEPAAEPAVEPAVEPAAEDAAEDAAEEVAEERREDLSEHVAAETGADPLAAEAGAEPFFAAEPENAPWDAEPPSEDIAEPGTGDTEARVAAALAGLSWRSGGAEADDAPEAEPTPGQQELEETIRRVVREELGGEMGRRLSENIRRMIQDEVARAMLRRG